MPECWAMIQGHEELFNYLRATRLRQEAKMVSNSASSSLFSTCVPISSMALVGPERKFQISFKDNIKAALILQLFFWQTTSEFAGDETLSDRDPSMLGITAVKSSATSSSVGSFCICGQGFVGKMIACEKAGCTIEWFHFQCVGLLQEVSWLTYLLLSIQYSLWVQLFAYYFLSVAYWRVVLPFVYGGEVHAAHYQEALAVSHIDSLTEAEKSF